MARFFNRDPEPTELELRLREQDRQAGVLLVAADEQVRTSREELQFQRAAVGEYEVQPFADALERAQAMLAEAFELRQLLDDHIPDSDAQRDQWSRRIHELANAVIATLAEQGEAFERLRAIQHDVPATVRVVSEQLAELRQRHAAASAVIDHLAAQFSPTVAAKAKDDAAQAATMLSLAERALGAAERRLGTGVQEGAPDMVDAARTAMQRADKLLDSLEAREGDLVAAQVDLTQLQSHAEDVLAEAMVSLSPEDAAQSAAIARLSDLLGELGPSASPDPAADGARLRAAVQVVEAPLLAKRTQARQLQAARAALPGHVRQARDYIQWTEDFAASRRTTLGPQARTRLSEARRYVELAEAEPDPAEAITLAQRASHLATEAWNIAHADIEEQQAGPSARTPGQVSPEGKTAAVAVAAGIGGLLLGSMGRGWGLGGFDLDDLFD